MANVWETAKMGKELCTCGQKPPLSPNGGFSHNIFTDSISISTAFGKPSRISIT
jgi:hypothetical protein